MEELISLISIDTEPFLLDPRFVSTWLIIPFKTALLENLVPFEILSTSTGSCWAINSYCPIKGVGPTSPADNDFRPGFSADLMLKDLTIALKAIESTSTSAPFGKNSRENFERMVNGNQGSLDFSAITKFNK